MVDYGFGKCRRATRASAQMKDMQTRAHGDLRLLLPGGV